MCLHVSPYFHTAQRNFQSTLVAWYCSQEVCPVTAAGIWAFSPEKSVFPGFLRKGPTLPLLGHIEWRGSRWAFEPWEALLHQTLSSEATCCPVPIGPSWGVCPGMGASKEKNTPHFALWLLQGRRGCDVLKAQGDPCPLGHQAIRATCFESSFLARGIWSHTPQGPGLGLRGEFEWSWRCWVLKSAHCEISQLLLVTRRPHAFPFSPPHNLDLGLSPPWCWDIACGRGPLLELSQVPTGNSSLLSHRRTDMRRPSLTLLSQG